MMMETPATATGSIDVAADSESVYRLVSDLGTMIELADETERIRWTRGAPGQLGAVFKGSNRNGWRRWTTTGTIADALPGRRFAFEVTHTIVKVARWQYDIEATASGCRVTESTWDRRPAWFRIATQPFTGVADRAGRNHAHIRSTLERLKARAEADAAAVNPPPPPS